VRAQVQGAGVDRLVLHGPEGELATTGADALEHELVLGEEGVWLAAAAYGDTDPHTLGAPVFAHTGPVHVDSGGVRVARPASARWCLELLENLERLVRDEGRFDPARREEQLGDLVDVIDRARAVYRAVLSARR
jgi:hypothetical protein